eukprot:CAMPEP_0118945776 /NCGR_PEP_ID=MMETSP1169-20130426/42952_1 /TAXON_ID=36882 /ORGANISM="Pyramimonas obovata, Strain CCMP722" /LENGTH=132 /DNA_ID=CAMNT_0006891565 /DNA_START=237 /DNA_END=633 /DNA_ORIENTATION=+
MENLCPYGSGTEDEAEEDLGLDNKDMSFDNMIKELHGTIKGRVVERPPPQEMLDQEVRDSGRITQTEFGDLFLRYHRERKAGNGHQATVAALASRAKVSEELLSSALLHTSLATDIITKKVSDKDYAKKAIW